MELKFQNVDNENAEGEHRFGEAQNAEKYSCFGTNSNYVRPCQGEPNSNEDFEGGKVFLGWEWQIGWVGQKRKLGQKVGSQLKWV